MTNCRICGNERENIPYIVKEMMLGSRDEFEYFKCVSCGCLQIKDYPANLSKYYPDQYYSFNPPGEQEGLRDFFSLYLKRQRTNYHISSNNWLGFAIALLRSTGFSPMWDWFRFSSTSTNSKILDVGCGGGKLIYELYLDGFTDLWGIDPFIPSSLSTDNLKVIKGELADITGNFDFIMLHHSFEHMADQLTALNNLFRLLKPQCYLLIRIPVIGYAWRKYGVSWCQLDAPRHFYIHTTASMEILAKKAGFEIRKVVYDSTAAQFIASEDYQRNISPMDSPCHLMAGNGTEQEIPRLSEAEIKRFVDEAIRLNESNDGDQACFYLYKPTEHITD